MVSLMNLLFIIIYLLNINAQGCNPQYASYSTVTDSCYCLNSDNFLAPNGECMTKKDIAFAKNFSIVIEQPIDSDDFFFSVNLALKQVGNKTEPKNYFISRDNQLALYSMSEKLYLRLNFQNTGWIEFQTKFIIQNFWNVYSFCVRGAKIFIDSFGQESAIFDVPVNRGHLSESKAPLVAHFSVKYIKDILIMRNNSVSPNFFKLQSLFHFLLWKYINDIVLYIPVDESTGYVVNDWSRSKNSFDISNQNLSWESSPQFFCDILSEEYDPNTISCLNKNKFLNSVQGESTLPISFDISGYSIPNYFSLQFHFKIRNAQSTSCLIEIESIFSVTFSSQTQRLSLSIFSSKKIADTVSTFSEDQWYSASLVLASGGEYSLFIDDKLEILLTDSEISMQTSSKIRIFNNLESLPETQFFGVIREVRIWNISLNSTQINIYEKQQLYQHPNIIFYAPLVAISAVVEYVGFSTYVPSMLEEPYFKEDPSALTYCTLRRFWDKTNMKCSDCMSDCVYCYIDQNSNNNQICLFCDPLTGKVPDDNGKCTCGAAKYVNINNICKECPLSCISCYSTNNCTSCQRPTYYLHYGLCTQECPYSFHANSTTQSCDADFCGDLLVNGDEQCDSVEGCDPTFCKSLPGFKCDQIMNICQSVCGDGMLIVSAEECDDSNTKIGDGCNENCQIEKGWACKTEGKLKSKCNPICGDGIKLFQEECDDGNWSNFDGCSDICEIETGSSCQGGSEVSPDICDCRPKLGKAVFSNNFTNLNISFENGNISLRHNIMCDLFKEYQSLGEGSTVSLGCLNSSCLIISLGKNFKIRPGDYITLLPNSVYRENCKNGDTSLKALVERGQEECRAIPDLVLPTESKFCQDLELYAGFKFRCNENLFDLKNISWKLESVFPFNQSNFNYINEQLNNNKCQSNILISSDRILASSSYEFKLTFYSFLGEESSTSKIVRISEWEKPPLLSIKDLNESQMFPVLPLRNQSVSQTLSIFSDVLIEANIKWFSCALSPSFQKTFEWQGFKSNGQKFEGALSENLNTSFLYLRQDFINKNLINELKFLVYRENILYASTNLLLKLQAEYPTLYVIGGYYRTFSDREDLLIDASLSSNTSLMPKISFNSSSPSDLSFEWSCFDLTENGVCQDKATGKPLDLEELFYQTKRSVLFLQRGSLDIKKSYQIVVSASNSQQFRRKKNITLLPITDENQISIVLPFSFEETSFFESERPVYLSAMNINKIVLNSEETYNFDWYLNGSFIKNDAMTSASYLKIKDTSKNISIRVTIFNSTLNKTYEQTADLKFKPPLSIPRLSYQIQEFSEFENEFSFTCSVPNYMTDLVFNFVYHYTLDTLSSISFPLKINTADSTLKIKMVKNIGKSPSSTAISCNYCISPYSCSGYSEMIKLEEANCSLTHGFINTQTLFKIFSQNSNKDSQISALESLNKILIFSTQLNDFLLFKENYSISLKNRILGILSDESHTVKNLNQGITLNTIYPSAEQECKDVLCNSCGSCLVKIDSNNNIEELFCENVTSCGVDDQMSTVFAEFARMLKDEPTSFGKLAKLAFFLNTSEPFLNSALTNGTMKTLVLILRTELEEIFKISNIIDFKSGVSVQAQILMSSTQLNRFLSFIDFLLNKELNDDIFTEILQVIKLISKLSVVDSLPEEAPVYLNSENIEVITWRAFPKQIEGKKVSFGGGTKVSDYESNKEAIRLFQQLYSDPENDIKELKNMIIFPNTSLIRNGVNEVIELSIVNFRKQKMLQEKQKDIKSNIYSLFVTEPGSLNEIPIEDLSQNITFYHSAGIYQEKKSNFTCQHKKSNERNGWSGKNCYKVEEAFLPDGQGIVVCGCNHFTDFAVIEEAFMTSVEQTNAELLLKTQNLGAVDYFETDVFFFCLGILAYGSATVYLCQKYDKLDRRGFQIHPLVSLDLRSSKLESQENTLKKIRLSPENDLPEKKNNFAKEMLQSPNIDGFKDILPVCSPSSSKKIRIFSQAKTKDTLPSLGKTKSNNWVSNFKTEDPPTMVSIDFQMGFVKGGTKSPQTKSLSDLKGIEGRLRTFLRGVRILYGLTNVLLSIKITHPYLSIYFLYNPYTSRPVRAFILLLRIQSFLYLTALLLPTLGYEQTLLVNLFTILIGKGFNGIIRAIIEKLLNSDQTTPFKKLISRIQFVGVLLVLAYFGFTDYFLYSFGLHTTRNECRTWLISSLMVIAYDFVFKLFGIIFLAPLLVMINKDFAQTKWFKAIAFLVKAAFVPFDVLFTTFIISK